MPQLRPILGFIIFVFILSSYFLLLSRLSKKLPFVSSTKVQKTSKPSISYFQ